MSSTHVAPTFHFGELPADTAEVFDIGINDRLPIIQGPYAGNFAALLAVGLVKDSNLGATFGSFCIASLIWCLLSVPIRNVSVVGLFARYLRSHPGR